jgi:hypothetical protein
MNRTPTGLREARNMLGPMVLLITLAASTEAGTLKPETLKAWNQYIQTASAGMQHRLAGGGPFLWVDESPDRIERVRRGEILVSAANSKIPMRVPSGLIHDWLGATFIPNATIADVLSVERDYAHYKDIYKPVIIDCKAIAMNESQDLFAAVLMNRSLVSKTALESTNQSDSFRLDGNRAYGFTRTTRIQEIENYDTPRQHKLPVDQGTGFIWRLFSIARYQQRDGGVYIEVEGLALSRDVPFSLRWLVDPIVRRVSRESLLTSLKQTGDAVRSSAILTHRHTIPSGGVSGVASSVRQNPE